MSPLSVPTATVKFKIRMTATSVIPPRIHPMIIATSVPGDVDEHGKQCELPRERLSPGLHIPHSNPERL